MDSQKIAHVSSIEIKKWKEHVDGRGKLSAVEYQDIIPFLVKRIFYLYNLSPSSQRGDHAHKEQEQFLICVAGSVSVKLTDKQGRSKNFVLKNPNEGIYIPPCIWVNLSQFSQNTVCLVLVSDKYSESDYIRDYNTFLAKD